MLSRENFELRLERKILNYSWVDHVSDAMTTNLQRIQTAMRKAVPFLLALLLLAGSTLAQHAVEPVRDAKDLESTGTGPVEADFPLGGLVNLHSCASGLLIKGT